jgi:hypothetical protein
MYQPSVEVSVTYGEQSEDATAKNRIPRIDSAVLTKGAIQRPRDRTDFLTVYAATKSDKNPTPALAAGLAESSVLDCKSLWIILSCPNSPFSNHVEGADEGGGVRFRWPGH